jgi:hypothetical protein
MKIFSVLHPRFEKGNDGFLLPAVTNIYPGDWEDTAGGVAGLGYSVCSVEARPSWTSMPTTYPDGSRLDCPDKYKPFYSGCYRVVTSEKTFDQAQEYCKNEGTQIKVSFKI